MKKTLASIAALVLTTSLSVLTTNVIASNATKNSGMCNSGASWSITAKRTGNLVKATFTATKLNNNPWNVNVAWIPENKVGNALITPKKGTLVYNTSTLSSAPATLYVWIDQSDVFNCIAAITA